VSKKDENARRFKLKTERAKIRLDQIAAETLPTIPAAAGWGAVLSATLARLDKLPRELLSAVSDRRHPGPVQDHLQRVVYGALTEISKPNFAASALGMKKRGRKRA
jgi:hypothetical protein